MQECANWSVKKPLKMNVRKQFWLDAQNVKRRLAISEPRQLDRVELVVAVGVDRRHNLPTIELLVKVHHVAYKVADGRAGQRSQERTAVVDGPQGMVGWDSYFC